MWEYQTVRVHLDDATVELSRWGKVGWELVAVVQEPEWGPMSQRRMSGDNRDTVVAFFKRRV